MSDAGGSGGPLQTGDAAARRNSELVKRVVSAAVMIPVVIAATWYGGAAFAALAAIGAAIVLSEWVGLTGRSHYAWLDWAAGATVVASVTLTFLGRTDLAVIALVIAAAVLSGVAVANRRTMALAAGLAYAGSCGVALVALRFGDNGLIAILFVYAIVWGTDIAAYFAGRAIGGPKLWPKVSPKKTWSGALGGLCFGTAAGLGVCIAGGIRVGVAVVAVAVFLSIAGQLGDLLESAIKRRAGKKDSGTLIPGHGGLMDRVDALIVAAVSAAVIGWSRAGLTAPADGLLVW